MASIPNAYIQSISADPKQDWRVAVALTSTALWLLMGFSYIALQIGWQTFLRQPVEALGGFLEGAFAPLAFLWLVVGSFLQQRELRQNNIAIQAQYMEMRRSAENSEIQSRAIHAAFEGLLHLIRRCDPDGVIGEAVRGGGNGLIYQIICDLETEAPRPS
jgi:hypothetical protein